MANQRSRCVEKSMPGSKRYKFSNGNNFIHSMTNTKKSKRSSTKRAAPFRPENKPITYDYKPFPQKVTMCKFFISGKICPFYPTCSFAHGQTDLKVQKTPDTFKLYQCRYEIKGEKCPFDVCNYLHHDDDPCMLEWVQKLRANRLQLDPLVRAWKAWKALVSNHENENNASQTANNQPIIHSRLVRHYLRGIHIEN